MDLESQSKYEEVLQDLWSSSEDEANVARTATFYNNLLPGTSSEPDETSRSSRTIRWQRSSRLGRNINMKRKHGVSRYRNSDSSSKEAFVDDCAILYGDAQASTSRQPARQQTQERHSITVIDTGTSSGVSDSDSAVRKKSPNPSCRSRTGEGSKDKKRAPKNRVMVLRSSSSSTDSSDSESLLSPRLRVRINLKSGRADDGFVASPESSEDQSIEQTHQKNSKRQLNIDNDQVLGQKRARLSPVLEPPKSGSSGNSAKEKPQSKISHPTSRTNDPNSQSCERYVDKIIDLFGTESDDGSDAMYGNETKVDQRRGNHNSQDSNKTDSSGVSIVKSNPIPVPAGACGGAHRNDKLSGGNTSKSLLFQNADDTILKKPSCSAGRNDTVILVDITQSAERGAMAGQVSPNANSSTLAKRIDSENVESESPILVGLRTNKKTPNRYTCMFDSVITGTESFAAEATNRRIPEGPSAVVSHQQQLESDNSNSNSPEICSPFFSHQAELPSKRDYRPLKHKAAVGTRYGEAPTTGSSLKRTGERTSQDQTPRKHLSVDGANRKMTLHRPIAKKQMKRVSSEASISDLHQKGYSAEEVDYLVSKTSFEENRLEWMRTNRASAYCAFMSHAESPHFTSTSFATSKQHSAERRLRNRSLQSSKEAPSVEASGGNWRFKWSDNCGSISPIFAKPPINPESRVRSRSRPRGNPPAANESQVIRNSEFEQQNRHTCSHQRSQEVINLDLEQAALGGNSRDTDVVDTSTKSSRKEARIPDNNREVINLDTEEMMFTGNVYGAANRDISANTQSTKPQVLRNGRSRQRSSTREHIAERNSTREVEEIRTSRSSQQRTNSNSGSAVSRGNRVAFDPDVRLIEDVLKSESRRVDGAASGISEARNMGAPQSPDLEIMEAIRQMEDDEAMAKQLQERFDAEEASRMQQNRPNMPNLPRLHVDDYSSEPRFEYPGPIQLGQPPHAPRRHRPPTAMPPPRHPTEAAHDIEMVWRDHLVDMNAMNMALIGQMYPDNNVDMQGHINRRTRPRQGRARGRPRNRLQGLTRLMQNDVDGNDYEALLNLAETVGQALSKGLPESSINLLPTFQFKSLGKDAVETECTICMCDYEAGESMRRLPCFHFYHAACIDKWLKENRICPVCREEVNFDPLNFN